MIHKFPRFTREENGACKLTDEQIKEIRWRRKNGEVYREIAQRFGVGIPAVQYWCLSDEARDLRNQRGYLLYRKGKKFSNDANNKTKLKKARLKGEEIRKYSNELSCNMYWKHREKRAERARKRYLKNKDKIAAWHKKFYRENRDKCVAQHKIYYKKHKKEIMLNQKLRRQKKRLAQELKLPLLVGFTK